MYIAPNSTIELYKGLKLDNNYSNTMWFANVSDQNTFFNANKSYTLNNYSYQRKDIGVIRVEKAIEDAFDINYMRFVNSSFENRWFYAFVTKVEYINNITCNLYYTIDVIQTYMFDWTLNQCLIERQHSTTDVAGDNLIAEGLELGDYINSAVGGLYKPSPNLDGYSYLVCVGLTEDELETITESGSDTEPDEYGYFQLVAYQFAMLAYLKYDQGSLSSNVINLMDYLSANNKIDSIASITFIPKDFSIQQATDSEFINVAKPTAIHGYIPVNQKLLTYPYCYMDIFNDQNEHMELRYELSNSPFGMRFRLYQIISPTPEAVVIPQDYNAQSDSPEVTLTMGGFPQIPYFNDSYKAWQALNYDQMVVARQISAQEMAFAKQGIGISQKELVLDTAVGAGNAVVGAFKTAMNPLGGGIAGAIGQAALGGVAAAGKYEYGSQKNDLASSKAEYENYAVKLRQSADESRARNLPNSPHVGSSSSAVSTLQKGFWYNLKSIRQQYAIRIDKYFTMFGYAQNIVGIPNIHVRRYFTYVKTTGSCVSGSIPQDDREVIDTIFDRGIRFWTDYSNFENYNVSNTILS